MAGSIKMTSLTRASAVSPLLVNISDGFEDRLSASTSSCSISRKVTLSGPLRIEARQPVKKEATNIRGGRGTSKKVSYDRKQNSLASSSNAKLSGGATIKTNWNDEGDKDALADDPFEALLMQLEQDLEAGGLSDADEEMTEDDILQLEKDLTAALMDDDEDVIDVESALISDLDDFDEDKENGLSHKSRTPKQIGSVKEQSAGSEVTDGIGGDLIVEEIEDEEDEQRVVSLEPWQLKKLAAAAQLGRRHSNIKALAKEVGLDRFDVLAWLKDPPPEMLLYCAEMEREEDPKGLLEETKSSSISVKDVSQTKSTDDSPEVRRNWSSQKRLRKVHAATFELVFSKSTRPSNAMVQNLVDNTHVPRKRILQWFEARRKEVKARPKFDGLQSSRDCVKT